MEEIMGRIFACFGQKSWEFCLISQLFFNIYMAMKNNILYILHIYLLNCPFINYQLAISLLTYESSPDILYTFESKL